MAEARGAIGLRASVAPQIQTTREVELEADLEGMRREIARLAEELSAARARLLEESEPEIVRLAMAVAARVVGREVIEDPSVILPWIEEGLAALPGRDEIAVAVASDIAAALSIDDMSRVFPTRKLFLDATLAPGTCELREGTSTVEVGARARLAALSDALGVDRDR